MAHSLLPLPVQPSSQPSSPAPGAPAQMDLEQPFQPLFGSASALKTEPPGYEEAVNQQPKQQVTGAGAGQGMRQPSPQGGVLREEGLGTHTGRLCWGFSWFPVLVSQENGSSSQQMDDLFDILIQSGGNALRWLWPWWLGPGN